MPQTNNNKLLETILLIASAVGGILGLINVRALYLAIPSTAIAMYLNQNSREKMEDYLKYVDQNCLMLEQKINEHLEQFENTLNTLPNHMISYYTERLSPLISQIQSQQKVFREKFKIIEKTSAEKWQKIEELEQSIQALDEKFFQRPEIKEIKNLKDVISHIYQHFNKYIKKTEFQEELINLTQSLTALKNQIDWLVKAWEKQNDFNSTVVIKSDLLIDEFVKKDQLYEQTNQWQQQLSKYLTNQEFREYHDQVCTLITRNSSNLVNKKMLEEVENQLAKLQISINNFVTVDTLSQVMDDFLSKDEIEYLKKEINQLSQKLDDQENLDILNKIRGVLDRLVKQEDLEHLQDQFQLLLHQFNNRPELNLIENMQMELAEINQNLLTASEQKPLMLESVSGSQDHHFMYNGDYTNGRGEDDLIAQLIGEDYDSDDNLVGEILEETNNSIYRENMGQKISDLNQQVQQLLELQADYFNTRSFKPLNNEDSAVINENLQDIQHQLNVLTQLVNNMPSQQQVDRLTQLLVNLEVNQKQDIEPTNLEYLEIIRSLIISMETSIDFFVTSEELEVVEGKIHDLRESINERIDVLPSLEHITDLIFALKAMVTKEELRIVKKDIDLQLASCVKWQDLEIR